MFEVKLRLRRRLFKRLVDFAAAPTRKGADVRPN